LVGQERRETRSKRNSVAQKREINKRCHLHDEVQQEAVRRVCGALGMREQFEAAMAAGELLEMLESLPRGAVEASVRQMRGYNRTGEWPEPILTSPAPQRGRSPSPVDEWSDG